MDYFQTLPKLAYRERDSTSLKVVSNVFKRAQITLESKINRTLYYPYDIKEGETPEFIATAYYGSPKFHWVVLLTNEMTDPHWDWPLPSVQFEKYIVAKYGSLEAASTTTHHNETIELKAEVSGYGYEVGDVYLAGGVHCNSDFTFSVAGESVADFQKHQCVKNVSNYDYEHKLNESKRKIKLLDRQYLGSLVEQFERIVGSTVGRG